MAQGHLLLNQQDSPMPAMIHHSCENQPREIAYRDATGNTQTSNQGDLDETSGRQDGRDNFLGKRDSWTRGLTWAPKGGESVHSQMPPGPRIQGVKYISVVDPIYFRILILQSP